MMLYAVAVAVIILFYAGSVGFADEIAKSVGQNCVNDEPDVHTIQILLNQIPSEIGGPHPLLTPDGRIGPATISAIEAFQRKRQGEDAVDSSVDPNGKTIELINASVSAQSLNRRIAIVAESESLFWQDGIRKETSDRVATRLQMYWKAVEQNYTTAELGDADFQENHPWSSAFVSWVMKRAGAKEKFHYSAAHQVYLSIAKANQINGVDGLFKAYPVSEKPIEVGDVVVKRRSNGIATFENIDNGQTHPTHGDIVISVVGDKATTIGGNIRNSVKNSTIALDGNRIVENNHYFAVVKVQ